LHVREGVQRALAITGGKTGALRLQVLRRQSSVLCNACKHARPNFFAIVKGEDKI
jgi:hypothetical protein